MTEASDSVVTMKGALDGVRVLDLTRILAGPYCTMILADHGAEVIKVESPGKGDDTRAFGPPFQNGESAYFLSVNRNKRSITVNLKHPDGLAAVRELARRADVVVENFRPGAAAKLGLGPGDVARINPRAIYASVSGFGQTGPWRNRAGYDVAVQGISGLQSITGTEGGPPTKVGTSIADLLSGIYCAQGILLALYRRERTGKGEVVDVSMLDSVVSLLTYQAGIYFAGAPMPTRLGNRHPTIAPYETFPAKDGYFNLAVGNDALWQKFCEVVGRAELAADGRFATNPLRVKNHAALYPAVEAIAKTKTVSEWLALLEGAGIPAGPIFDLRQILEHEVLAAREMVVEMEHPKAGKIRVNGVPVKLAGAPGAVRTPPPVLGADTDAVLSELGYDKAKIQGMRDAGAV